MSGLWPIVQIFAMRKIFMQSDSKNSGETFRRMPHEASQKPQSSRWKEAVVFFLYFSSSRQIYPGLITLPGLDISKAYPGGLDH